MEAADLKNELILALMSDYDVPRFKATKAVEKWDELADSTNRGIEELAEEIYETEEYWDN